MTGALTSSLAAPEALSAPPRGVILATPALDEPRFPPQALRAGYPGQQHGERGVRCLNDPRVLASALDLQQPERIMALLRGMTVCWLVSAALEARLRQAPQDHRRPSPTSTGNPFKTPRPAGASRTLSASICSVCVGGSLRAASP